MQIILFILLFSASAWAGLPPTATQGSGDATLATTFNFKFPNMDLTHAGTTITAGKLYVPGGGTGLSSVTANRILAGNGAGPLQVLSAGSSNQVLHSNGASLPTWSLVDLTADVTGVLPVANGGTNIASYSTGDILYASGATTLTKLAAGTNGHVLTLAGGIPSWAANASGDVTGVASSVSGEVALFNDTTGKKLSRATGTGFAKLTSGVLSAQASVALSTDVSGVLPAANGGTGQSSLPANRVLLGNGTSPLLSVANGTSGDVLTYNGTTWVSAAASAPAAAKVLLNWAGTAQPIAHNTMVKLTIASPTFSTLTDFTNSSGTLTYTAATSANFEVDGSWQLNTISNSTTQRVIGLAIYKNGSEYWWCDSQGGVINSSLSSKKGSASCRTVVSLATNDTVEFYAFQSNDGGTTFDAQAVQIFIKLWQ